MNKKKITVSKSTKNKKENIQLSKTFTDLISNVSSLNSEKKSESIYKKTFSISN